MTGLDAGTTYDFQLRAVNDGGNGAEAEVSVTVKHRVINQFDRVTLSSQVIDLPDDEPIRTIGRIRLWLASSSYRGLTEEDFEVVGGTLAVFFVRGSVIESHLETDDPLPSTITLRLREDAITNTGGNVAQEMTWQALPLPSVALSSDAEEPVTRTVGMSLAFDGPLVIEGRQEGFGVQVTFSGRDDIRERNCQVVWNVDSEVDNTYRANIVPAQDFEGEMMIWVPAGVFANEPEYDLLNARSNTLTLRADTRDPSLEPSTVNRATVMLIYHEALDETSVPAAGDFAVMAGTSSIDVSSVTLSGTTLTLTLASAVAAGETVTIDYTPGSNPIKDLVGHEAAALSGRALMNNTPGVLVTPTALSVPEGGSADYSVVLQGAPSADVTVDALDRLRRRRRPDAGLLPGADLHHDRLGDGADGDGERRRGHGHG